MRLETAAGDLGHTAAAVFAVLVVAAAVVAAAVVAAAAADLESGLDGYNPDQFHNSVAEVVRPVYLASC